MKEVIKVLLMNLANLFKVKTILSLIYSFTTCYLTIKRIIDPATFMGLTGAIIAFYFTKDDKKEGK